MTEPLRPHLIRAADGLHFEGACLEDLARGHGTPLFVYSARAITERFGQLARAFAPFGGTIAYSVKANSNLGILRLLDGLGAAFDVVSGGEMARLAKLSVPGARIIFAGVGKREEELRQALAMGVREINVESVAEAERLDGIAREAGVRAPIALRINPDIDADTHHHITTGKTENKFGIAPAVALELAARTADDLAALEVRGVHFHLGSQISKASVFEEAIELARAIIPELRQRGAEHLTSANFGGGFGVNYATGALALDIDAVAARIGAFCREFGLAPVVEPGRSIVASAGVLLTRVEYVKAGEEKHFAVVDAAMTELIRPALYEARHEVVACGRGGGAAARYDVVGPVCESADFLAKGVLLPALSGGELLAVLDAGAYAQSMASNYNSRPRAAEVLVEDGAARLVRRRETMEDLMGPELECL